MSFYFSTYSTYGYKQLSVNSPNGDLHWLIGVQQNDDLYKNWTVGQVEVHDYVKFITDFYWSNRGWSAIDNIVFSNSADCETIPHYGGNI